LLILLHEKFAAPVSAASMKSSEMADLNEAASATN
jgi:hypothetical protein